MIIVLIEMVTLKELLTLVDLLHAYGEGKNGDKGDDRDVIVTESFI